MTYAIVAIIAVAAYIYREPLWAMFNSMWKDDMPEDDSTE